MNKTKAWVNLKQTYNMAAGEISFVRSVMQIDTILLALTTIALYAPEFKGIAVFIAPIAVACYIGTMLILGRLMDKKLKLVQTYTNWSNNRNPQIQEILRKLDELKGEI
jgi:hypothetical protein